LEKVLLLVGTGSKVGTVRYLPIYVFAMEG